MAFFMLCFRMLSRFSDPSCLIDSASLPARRPLSTSASSVFNNLRTLSTSLRARITSILFPINGLRTLAKTTEGGTHHFSFSLFHSPFSRLNPLESALAQHTPVNPVKSAFTKASVQALWNPSLRRPGEGVPRFFATRHSDIPNFRPSAEQTFRPSAEAHP